MKREFAILTTVFMLFVQSVYAQWIIPPPHPPRPPHPRRPSVPLSIERHRVEVEIDNQTAHTKIDQIFRNENSFVMEGTYIFPLPDDASVSSFAMYVNGERMKAELLSADEARDIYEDIVRKMKDPALLEYFGLRAFRARVFPIPANGEKRIQLEYSQSLKVDSGIVKYAYPLNTEKFSQEPVDNMAVSVKIKSNQLIKSVYSPTHRVDVYRKDDYHATLGYEGTNVKAERNFICYYTLSEKNFGIDLIAHRDNDEDGYFMLLVAPKQEIDESDVLPKDIIFVLDKSGSMKGKKIEQAKEALSFCIKSLNEDDRFNLINFSTDVYSLSEKLLKNNEKNRKKALHFIEKTEAVGGTNINEALLKALKEKPDEKRPRMVVFLTDGKPTVGKTDVDTIIENVEEANEKRMRVFVFGVGYNVNTVLLDKLSETNRGTSQYVEPKENIEVAVSSFYTKISKPVLANLKIDTGSVEMKEVYPQTLPDLFRGSQLTLLGRYENPDEVLVKLIGEINGKEQTFEDEVNFPEHSEEHDFLPRLWAQRKVAYLIDAIRLHGENKELKDEIVRLSKKYGIMTPYTSFLVHEDLPQVAASPSRPRGEPGGRQIRRNVVDNITLGNSKSGKTAVQRSEKLQKMKESSALAAVSSSAEKTSSVKIKHVGSKTFYLKDDVWVDSEYTEKTKTKDIEYSSEEYFKLLQQQPELRKYFAISTQVIVCYKGKCYQVTSDK